jgi:predicted acylesterase/phospholipase RssA
VRRASPPPPDGRRTGSAGPAARPRIGLALAGGGPLGAIWEIGALNALAEALPGVDFVALDGYVGVSAGGFLAAGLANGMTPRQMCAAFIEDDAPSGDRIDPSAFMRPAWGEFARRGAALPGLALQVAWQALLGGRSWLSAAERLGRALPAGLFSHGPIEAQLRHVLGQPGRSNDFRQLRRRLVLVATDLDSGTAAPFGMPGWDHVPISVAVAASAALPGLFPPVPVQGRWYADGALKKTLHASVLLDLGLDLVICLNPLVPFDASHPQGRRVLGSPEPAIPRLVEGGLPVVMSQTFRSLIHSRLELGLKGYAHSHPDTDILLFEPDHRDPTMFLANTFGYRQRRALAEHAYERMRHDLRERRGALNRQLARHGLALDAEVLADRQRRLLAPRVAGRRSMRTLHRLHAVLDRLEDTLAAR